MASERPTPKRRTPRVAGRSTARVEISEQAQERRAARAADAGDSESTTASTPKTSLKKDPQPKRSVGLDKPSGESGVDRKRRLAEEEKAAADADRAGADVEPGVKDTRSTYRLAAILGAIAVVLGAVAAVFALHPGADVSDNRAFVDQGTTEKVLAQTREVACAPFRYDYKKIDQWFADVQTRLTGSALDQFRTFMEANRKLIVDTKSASDCRVDTVGMIDLDHDRATMLANLVVSTTENGAITSSNMPQVRIVMQRDGDKWLAEAFPEP